MSMQSACDEARDRFLACLDDELPTVEAAALEAHLAACPACRAETGDLAALHRDLGVDAVDAGDGGAEAGLRSVLEAVRAEQDRRPAPAAPAPRPARRKVPVAPRPAWVHTLVAASVLVGAAALLAVTLQRHRPSTRPAAPPAPAAAPVEVARAAPETPAPPPDTTPVPPSRTPATTESPAVTALRPETTAEPRQDLRPVEAPAVVAARETPAAAPPSVETVTPVEDESRRMPAAQGLPPAVKPPPAVTAPASPVIARIDAVHGTAFVLTGTDRSPAAAGADLRSGQGLETRGGLSRLAVRYPDGTRVELRGETVVRQVTDARPGAAGGEGWTLGSGTLVAEVARQPAEAPFIVRTPSAEATVVGTAFRIECSSDATQLEVREGKVKLARVSDRASITVPAGHVAATTPTRGDPLVARACRVDTGLLALYAFDEREGDTVHDVSGARAPRDLRIGNAEAVRWRPHGLQLTGAADIASASPVHEVANALRQRHELTFEAWVRADPAAQQGPAGLLLLSGCSLHRIAMLGYGGPDGPAAQVRAFLRTTEPDGDAKNWIAVPERTGEPRLAHLVFTRAAGGAVRLYVDGVERGTGRIPGEIPLCTVPHQLRLGEGLGGEPWRGEMHLAAVYGRTLSPDEVRRNYLAGCGGLACAARR